jgi:putative oxidoreductase
VQKLFGWLGGHGLPGNTGGFFEGLALRPGVLFVLAASLGELGGGLLTAAGFLGPVGSALIILVMLVAISAVYWPNGFFASSNGIELPLANLTAALAVAFAGPGAYSLDGLFGLTALADPASSWTAVAAAAGLAPGNLAVRRPTPAPARTHA